MSYIFDREDVFSLARSVGAETKQKGDELFFKWCPRCHGGGRDRETFSVNLVSGAFCCFRSSCGYKGHFVELARDLDFELHDIQPKIFKQLPQRAIEVRSPAIEYMATRGISEAVCRQYEVTTHRENPFVLVFPFHDEQGVLQFVKYRNTRFRKGVDKSKEWSEKDAKPILFGMKQCSGFDRLVITEGQIDSLTLTECGIKNAVSVPTGQGGFTWLPHCWDWITKFREVVVFGDNEGGKITLVDQLKARLPQMVKVVRRKDYLGEKDANDIFLRYGKQAIITAVENAEAPKLENVKDLATVERVDINSLPRIQTNVKEIDKVIRGLVMGQLILLTGKRGEGKSTLMSQFVCEALDQGENVFVYSGELPGFLFRRWIDYQLAGSDYIGTATNEYGEPEYTLADSVADRVADWYRGRAYIYDNEWIPEGDEMETIPETIEKVIRQYGTRLVCIDNLMTAMEEVDSQSLYQAQSNFVGRLKKIAMRYNVAIILVAHPRKSQGNFSNDDVSGSSDITNKVDVVMSYGRVLNQDYDGKLEITKNRNEGKLAVGDGAIRLLYSPKSRRIFSGSSDARRYGWEKEQQTVADNDWMI